MGGVRWVGGWDWVGGWEIAVHCDLCKNIKEVIKLATSCCVLLFLINLASAAVPCCDGLCYLIIGASPTKRTLARKFCVHVRLFRQFWITECTLYLPQTVAAVAQNSHTLHLYQLHSHPPHAISRYIDSLSQQVFPSYS